MTVVALPKAVESGSAEFALSNARVVLPDAVVHGTVVIRGGLIYAVDHALCSRPDRLDCEGDFLLPGLVDIHTDNIERHMFPRPGVRWPSPLSAVVTHDREMASAGVTTVFDALSLGDYDSGGARNAVLPELIDALTHAHGAELLRADHFLHLRCETSDPSVLELFEPRAFHPLLRLVSVMDHTPGQRQWRDLGVFRHYRQKKNGRTWSDSEFEAYLETCRTYQATHAKRHRETVIAASRTRALPLASHDDTTAEDVIEAHRDGITISEFPTTEQATVQARALGLAIVMGSPNVVLGRSHSGNVAAHQLAERNLLDALTSDYVPASLLEAVFILRAKFGVPLPKGIALASSAAALMVGLPDRGRIAPGLRADLIRVRLDTNTPIVRAVWRGGERVH